jgi:hypothetical protein
MWLAVALPSLIRNLSLIGRFRFENSPLTECRCNSHVYPDLSYLNFAITPVPPASMQKLRNMVEWPQDRQATPPQG